MGQIVAFNFECGRGSRRICSILLIRDERVMLDSHLAMLYEVQTKILNRVVKQCRALPK
jgi:hypothetical protein